MTTPATQLPPRTKPKKPFYKKWWGILLIIIVALTLIGVVAMLLAPSKKVPDVVGKTYSEAQKILDDAGFSSVTPQPKDGEVILAVSSSEVVAQDPQPGATAKVTTQIKLTISRANIEKKEKAAEAEKEAKADPLNSNKAKADIAAINIEQGQQRCHELLERKQGDAGRLEIDWATMKKTPWVQLENKDPEQGDYGLILEAKGKAIVQGIKEPALAIVKCSVYEMDGETYVDGTNTSFTTMDKVKWDAWK